MRTKRRAFATTLPEPLSSDFISFCVKNGYKYAEAIREGIRRLLTPVQYTRPNQSHARPWEYKPNIVMDTKRKRQLPLIPGTPEYKAHELSMIKNDVISELKIRLDERRKMMEEENLIKGVEIK